MRWLRDLLGYLGFGRMPRAPREGPKRPARPSDVDDVLDDWFIEAKIPRQSRARSAKPEPAPAAPVVSAVEVQSEPDHGPSRSRAVAVSSSPEAAGLVPVCRIIWGEESIPPDRLWIDAPRAAALAAEAAEPASSRAQRNPAQQVVVVIVRPDAIERHLLRLAPASRSWPTLVLRTGREDLALKGKPLGTVLRDGLVGGESRPVVVVVGPSAGPLSPDAHRAVIAAGALLLDEETLLDTFGRAWSRALRAGRAVWPPSCADDPQLVIAEACWGAALPASWRIEGAGAAGTMNLRLSPEALETHDVAFRVERRGPTRVGFVEEVRARVPGPSLEDFGSRLVLEVAHCAAFQATRGRLRRTSQRASARPIARTETLGAYWPVARPAPAVPESDPHAWPIAVYLMLGSDPLERSLAAQAETLVRSLAHHGPLGSLAVERGDSGTGARRVWHLDRDALPEDLAGWLLSPDPDTPQATETPTPEQGFTEALRRALRPSAPRSAASGVILTLIARSGARFGASSVLADEAGRWAWFLATRRALGVPLAITAILHRDATPSPELVQGLEGLVALGEQSRGHRPLLRYWTPAQREPDGPTRDAEALRALSRQGVGFAPETAARLCVVPPSNRVRSRPESGGVA